MSSAPELGIVAALAREARCLDAGFRGAHLPSARVRIAGIGSERALAAARALVADGARALVSFGVCGGLDPALRAGDLVIPERVLAADGASFACDAAWRRRLETRLAGVLALSAAPLLEARALLAEPAAKRAAFRASGAAAVDMESAAVASVAAEADIPFLALRAVCDQAEARIPRAALLALDARGRVGFARLLRALVSRPADCAELRALRRSFRAASAALEELARRAGPDLLFRCDDEPSRG